MILGVFTLLLLIRIFLYLNVCVIQSRNEAAYFAERLSVHPEEANEVIPYEMLSNEYKCEISLENYNNAIEPQEKLNLYSNPIFRKNTDRCVDITQSTEGYKKSPEGYFSVGEQWYDMLLGIDISPDPLTLKPEVVRWNISIVEVDTPPIYA